MDIPGTEGQSLEISGAEGGLENIVRVDEHVHAGGCTAIMETSVSSDAAKVFFVLSDQTVANQSVVLIFSFARRTVHDRETRLN